MNTLPKFKSQKETPKLKKPKRKRQDAERDAHVELRCPKKVLVPVTRESMSKVLGLLDKFTKEKRCAAIVFNSCFYHDEMPFDKIAEKFEPLFGKISPEQVFVRVDMPKLTDTPEEAYELKFKNLNQAYIVASPDCSENDLNRKAAARQIFCCPMTLGCIRKNLKLGLYLMHRSIVLGSEQDTRKNRPVIEVKPKLENKPEPAPCVKKPTGEKKQLVNSPPRKRDRIAATFNTPVLSCRQVCSESNETSPDLEQNQARVEGKLDEELWKSLLSCGDVVLRISNLPLRDNVNSFNLMIGTTSIKAQQMIARKRVIRKTKLMDVMLVLKSDSPDLITMMNKNGLKAAPGVEVRVERSRHTQLRKFLLKQNDRINFENSNKLPIKYVGYGNNCC